MIGSWRFLLELTRNIDFGIIYMRVIVKAKRAHDNVKGREYTIALLLLNNIERQKNTVNTEEEGIGLGN